MAPAARLAGHARLDGERMDRVLHQFAEGFVHHAVAGERRLAGEARRNDAQPPMRAATRPPARMTLVLRAFVDELELLGFEACEARANLGFDVHVPLPPSSMYLERKSACAITNSSIRPTPPNSLKLTQISVEKL